MTRIEEKKAELAEWRKSQAPAPSNKIKRNLIVLDMGGDAGFLSLEAIAELEAAGLAVTSPKAIGGATITEKGRAILNS